VLRIIRELINFEPQNKTTNIEVPLRFLTNAIKKRTIAFLVSDFYAPFNYTDALKISNKRHDVVAVRIFDKAELELPDVGLIKLRDNETGKIVWVDSSSKQFRKQYAVNRVKFDHDLKDLFNRSGIDATTVHTHESYVKPLMNLFKKR